MNTGNTFTLGLKELGKTWKRHKPGILSGIAVAGVIVEAIVLYKKAPKIQKIISVRKEEYEEAKKEGEFKDKAVVVLEAVKDLAPEVIPPAAIVGGTIFCIVESHKEHSRRNAALLSMLAISQADLKTYKEKIRDVVGKRKTEEIEGMVAQEHFDRNPYKVGCDDEYLTFADTTGEKTVIFYDPWTDRYFRNSIETVKDVFRDVMADLKYQDFVSLNEVHERLGMDPTIAGKFFGFFSTDVKDYYHIDDMVRFAAGTIRSSDMPCLELRYQPSADRDTFGEPIFID